jgi:hypothetical protein
VLAEEHGIFAALSGCFAFETAIERERERERERRRSHVIFFYSPLLFII